MHGQPSDEWTIAELAKRVGVLCSALAERFQHFLGMPPMTYLTCWRLQLGAQLLTSSSQTVALIAAQVGDESEQAFHRGFQALFGWSAVRFRLKSKPATA